MDDDPRIEQGSRISWTVPKACSPWPPAQPVVVEVRDAVLTPHDRVQRSVDGRRTVHLQGAVHDGQGWLVPQSQRVAGRNDRNVPLDPPRIAPPGDVEQLSGQWYYLGHWMWQFGHFLFETLPSLWAYQGEPMVAHMFGGSDPPAAWQLRFLELAGVSQIPRVVAQDPVQIEGLRVPSRPTVVGASADASAVDIWQRISVAGAGVADLAAGQGELVALSRSRLEAGRPRRGPKAGRMITNGEALDDLWRSRGFTLIHPEELSLDEQMRLMRGARALMGVDGSALHASAFARPGTPVIVVGNRDRRLGNLTQRAIDSALGHPEAVCVWQGVQEGSQDIDLDDHARKLDTALATLPVG